MSSKCCFCIDVRVGCFIIGYLNFFGQFLVGLYYIHQLANFDILIDQLKNDPATKKVITTDFKELAATIKLELIVVLSVCLIAIMFTISLLIGLIKNNRGLVMAYIVFQSLCSILVIGGLIVSIFYGGATAVNFISNLIAALINIYFLIVIINYRETMKGNGGTVTYSA